MFNSFRSIGCVQVRVVRPKQKRKKTLTTRKAQDKNDKEKDMKKHPIKEERRRREGTHTKI